MLKTFQELLFPKGLGAGIKGGVFICGGYVYICGYGSY